MNPLDLTRGRDGLRTRTGVATAVVVNNSDPEGLGRVKLQFPWSVDESESYWARVVAFMAGDDRGGYFLPEVGDEVLAAFENGDVEHPIVLGALWNGEDRPPETNADGENNIRRIKSRSGHQIVFDDTGGSEKVQLRSSAGHEITLDDAAGGEKITVRDKSGSEIVLDAVARKISIKSGMSISLEGQTIEIKAAATLTLQGGIVRIN